MLVPTRKFRKVRGGTVLCFYKSRYNVWKVIATYRTVCPGRPIKQGGDMNIKGQLFMSYHYRVATVRPRVHGGYAVMIDHVTITPNLDEVVTTFSRFCESPHKFRLAI